MDCRQLQVWSWSTLSFVFNVCLLCHPAACLSLVLVAYPTSFPFPGAPFGAYPSSRLASGPGPSPPPSQLLLPVAAAGAEGSVRAWVLQPCPTPLAEYHYPSTNLSANLSIYLERERERERERDYTVDLMATFGFQPPLDVWVSRNKVAI